MNFHVLSFASESIDIVDITDSAMSGSTDDVIYYLEVFKYQRRALHVSPSFATGAISFKGPQLCPFSDLYFLSEWSSLASVII